MVTRKHVKNDLQNEVMCHSLLLLAAVIQNKVPIHEISGAMMSQRITLILREPHQFSVENKDLEDISVNIDKNTSNFFMQNLQFFQYPSVVSQIFKPYICPCTL